MYDIDDERLFAEPREKRYALEVVKPRGQLLLRDVVPSPRADEEDEEPREEREIIRAVKPGVGPAEGEEPLCYLLSRDRAHKPEGRGEEDEVYPEPEKTR